MTDLLPCPFCGGEAKRQDVEECVNAGASYIECSRCNAATSLHFDRKENLVSSWNDRTPACGFSCNGVNVYGDKVSIDAVFDAFHSHGQIADLRRNLHHWREECGKLHAKIAILQANLTSWETTAKLVDQAEQAPLCEILQAHEMEKKVLYEALERALSHFAVMGGDHAARAAQEIEGLMAGVAEQSGAGAPETSVRCGAPASK